MSRKRLSGEIDLPLPLVRPEIATEHFKTRDVSHIEVDERNRVFSRPGVKLTWRISGKLVYCGVRASWDTRSGGFYTLDDLPAEVCRKCRRIVLKLRRKYGAVD